MSLVPKILFFCIFKDLECTFGISVLSIILITFPHENDIIRMFFTGGSREPLHTLSTRFDVGNECVHHFKCCYMMSLYVTVNYHDSEFAGN